MWYTVQNPYPTSQQNPNFRLINIEDFFSEFAQKRNPEVPKQEQPKDKLYTYLVFVHGDSDSVSPNGVYNFYTSNPYNHVSDITKNYGDKGLSIEVYVETEFGKPSTYLLEITINGN